MSETEEDEILPVITEKLVNDFFEEFFLFYIFKIDLGDFDGYFDTYKKTKKIKFKSISEYIKTSKKEIYENLLDVQWRWGKLRVKI